MIALYAALLAVVGSIGWVSASHAAPLATYYHVGAWDAFSGRTDDGHLVCGIGNTNSTDGRRFSIRFTVGEDAFLFTVLKPAWKIPDGMQASVVMQVGLERPWTERVTGDAQSLNWRLDQTRMSLFDGQFRRATSMTLAFPDGDEPAMLVRLTGSTAVSEAFARCIRDFSAMSQSGQPPAPPIPALTQPVPLPGNGARSGQSESGTASPRP